mmetsp:Transcript_20394/g.48663  ORF Transcript_20394/g.48663 Transcript_20394/m.48663 type:complete len:386 (-) Transcript_20394:143-1300(-)
MSLSGSFNRNVPMAVSKQAGVGLLLGEHKDSNVVLVKQVVPRGPADRTGRIKVGDQILRVNQMDCVGMPVSSLRDLIKGEMGSTVRMTFRSEGSGEVFEVELIRGTPEFAEAMQGAPSGMMGMPQAAPAQNVSLYASGNRLQGLNRYMLGTSWSAEMFAKMPPPQQTVDFSPARALQEENEWLRSALRMAESTIMRDRQELQNLREMFLQSKGDNENRIRGVEEQNKTKDDERREAEQSLLAAEEYRRTLEVKLAEAQRRSEWQRDTERQIQDNERSRLDYLSEVKRRAEEEKRLLEMEMMRLQDDLRSERASRLEAEARESSLRSDFSRLTEHRSFMGAPAQQQPNMMGRQSFNSEAPELGQPTTTITSSLEIPQRPSSEIMLA